MELILIRHLKTPGNEKRQYIGSTEEDLSEQEVLNFKKKCKQASYPQVQQVIVSPMKRCVQTAELIYLNMQMQLEPLLKECDFGIFEGKTYEELKDRAEYQAWLDSGGTIAFPNGESREEFIKRCCEGLREVFSQIEVSISKKEKIVQFENDLLTIGLVVHGGTIMALCSAFGGGEYFDYQVANGAGYICNVNLDGEEIRFQSIQKIEMKTVHLFRGLH